MLRCAVRSEPILDLVLLHGSNTQAFPILPLTANNYFREKVQLDAEWPCGAHFRPPQRMSRFCLMPSAVHHSPRPHARHVKMKRVHPASRPRGGRVPRQSASSATMDHGLVASLPIPPNCSCVPERLLTPNYAAFVNPPKNASAGFSRFSLRLRFENAPGHVHNSSNMSLLCSLPRRPYPSRQLHPSAR